MSELSAPTAVAVLTHVVRSIVDDPDAVSVEASEARGRLRLEVQAQERLGVRGAHQPPSVRRSDTHAVDIDDLGALRAQAILEFADHRELAVLGTVDAHLRRVDPLRQP